MEMLINSKRLLERVPSVGLNMLDEQHRQIQGYAMTLGGLAEDLVSGNGIATDIMEKFHWTINDLFESSCEHFQSEEQLLVTARYPFLAEHRIEHNKFIEMVTLLLYESTGTVADVYGISKLIAAWPEEHLHQWDTHACEYLRGTAVASTGKAWRPTESNISLQFSLDRIEGTPQALNLTSCDIGEVVAGVVAEWPPNRIELIATAVPPSLPCDWKLLQVALRNLISNGLRHSPSDEPLRLWVRGQPGGGVSIEINDTGSGIPDDEIGRVFQKYFRGRGALGTAGTGLGLHLVDRIAQMHGGLAKVETMPDHGSRFTLILPGSGLQ
jgi:hemerythrin-like metal-binding protein